MPLWLYSSLDWLFGLDSDSTDGNVQNEIRGKSSLNNPGMIVPRIPTSLLQQLPESWVPILQPGSEDIVMMSHLEMTFATIQLPNPFTCPATNLTWPCVPNSKGKSLFNIYRKSSIVFQLLPAIIQKMTNHSFNKLIFTLCIFKL
jgi:hypothetical protein